MQYQDALIGLVSLARKKYIMRAATNYSAGLRYDFIGAEIGVHRGRTAVRLLHAFDDLKIFLVDSWCQYPEEHPYRKTGDRRARASDDWHNAYLRTTVNAVKDFPFRTTILPMDASSAAGKLAHMVCKLDFVFIDAAHDNDSVTRDLWSWYPLVRFGGLFCGHDYGHHKYHGVKTAVDEFFARIGKPFQTCPPPAQAVWYSWKEE